MYCLSGEGWFPSWMVVLVVRGHSVLAEQHMDRLCLDTSCKQDLMSPAAETSEPVVITAALRPFILNRTFKSSLLWWQQRDKLCDQGTMSIWFHVPNCTLVANLWAQTSLNLRWSHDVSFNTFWLSIIEMSQRPQAEVNQILLGCILVQYLISVDNKWYNLSYTYY